MLSLRINSIVSPGEESLLLESPVRVLGIRNDTVLVVDLSLNPRKPWIIDKQLLVSEIYSGALVINVERPLAFLIRDENELSERERNSRDINWNLIKGMVEGKSALDVLTSNFGADVRTHAAEMGVDRKQIYRLLFRYWSMGQVKNAFLWNTDKCGGRGKAKSRKSGVVPGRPAKYRGVVVEHGAVLLDERHLSAIRLAYGLFASGKCGTIVKCHKWMVDKFYTEGGGKN